MTITPLPERFSSRWLFLLATVGAAVGLGNIWRFPFVVGSNGGGAFLVIYLAALVAIAMPVAAVELAAGRSNRKGIVDTLGKAGRAGKFVGVGVAIAATIVVSYYLVVTGWTLGYAVEASTGELPAFADFTQHYASLWWFLAAAAIALVVVGRGVVGGIELVSKVLTPLLLLVLLGLALYAPVLDDFGAAVKFYLVPDTDALLDPVTWAAAFGQAFFSVGVGMGVLVTYGAYVDDRQNLAGAAVGIALADGAIAFLAGLVVFPLAFSIGQSPEAGPELAFNALPEAFRRLGALGSVLAVFFYLSLFAAALTSAIALLEVGIVALREFSGLARKRAAPLLGVVVIALGAMSALSYTPASFTLLGQPVLDRLDDAMGRFGLPLGVLATATLIAWWRPALIEAGLPRPPLAGRGAVFVARWIVPAAIAGVLILQ